MNPIANLLQILRELCGTRWWHTDLFPAWKKIINKYHYRTSLSQLTTSSYLTYAGFHDFINLSENGSVLLWFRI